MNQATVQDCRDTLQGTALNPSNHRIHIIQRHDVLPPPTLMQAQKMEWLFGEEHCSDECDAFDSDVDEASTTQTMFMANLSSADPVYDEAGPSYYSDILSEANTLALLTQSYKTYIPQTNNQLRTSLNTRNQATIQDGRVVFQNVQGRQNRGQGNNAWGAGAAGYEGAQNRVRNANPGQARLIKYYNCNAQENGVALDEEQLLFIAADDCDAFDSDVDEAPTAQTMFMANLSSVYPVCDEAGPSYDSNILSKVHDHDHYQDAVYEHHEVHEMHDDVQPNYVVDSHADYTSDSTMILYDQYVMDNAVPVVQTNVSSIPNDAYMMILNDMHEQPA
ncbi:hypothetical protein Tco_0447935 [Tanacetum coccineum]